MKTAIIAILATFTDSSHAAETKWKPECQYKSAGIEVPAATADEPRVEALGPDTIKAAAKYLDDGAHHWVREKSCIACHSTGVYMVERSALTKWLGKPSQHRVSLLKTFKDGFYPGIHLLKDGTIVATTNANY